MSQIVVEKPVLHSYTGLCIDILKPELDSIQIEDIAHALSMQCRFGGRLKEFYSVAEHSVYVSQICDKEDALWGLLHDASEAYLVDIPRPLKYLPAMKGYLELEELFMTCIIDKFNLYTEEYKYSMPISVKKADDIMLLTEKANFLPEQEIWNNCDPNIKALAIKMKPLPQQEAKELFLNRFKELYKD